MSICPRLRSISCSSIQTTTSSAIKNVLKECGLKIYKWNQPSSASAAHPMLPQPAREVLHCLHQNRQLAWLGIEGPWSTLAGLYLEQIKPLSSPFVGASFLALQSALNQEECSLVGGRRSCRTRRRTVLKPQKNLNTSTCII